jgi:hypothetical protein
MHVSLLTLNIMAEDTHHILIWLKVKLSLCLNNYALSHEDVGGSGCIDPCILNLGSILEIIVSFAIRPLYCRGKGPHYLLGRKAECV